MKKVVFLFAATVAAFSMAMTGCQSQKRSSVNDTLQNDVSGILEKSLVEFDAEAGKVIVVETATGKIRAMAALVKNGSAYTADTLAFDCRHSTGIGQSVSLLAILEKGKLTLNSMIDTGNGVYVSRESGDTIYDPNWRQGGYGEISLRDVFTKGSVVGMAKAVEESFTGSNQLLEQVRKIIDDEGAPESFVTSHWQGPDAYFYLLDFYNAIANNGKMISTSDKEDSILVTNPQIAKAGNIDSLRSVLRQFIADGLGSKANSDKVNIAGACATKAVDGCIQCDFIGYFPAEAPKYTVFVSLKRKSRPMSAGAMCGPILKEIAEHLCVGCDRRSR
jgi:cell division protein FtsI (penicillin-binding protein 3)